MGYFMAEDRPFYINLYLVNIVVHETQTYRVLNKKDFNYNNKMYFSCGYIQKFDFLEPAQGT
jgi:hypothetical protein